MVEATKYLSRSIDWTTRTCYTIGMQQDVFDQLPYIQKRYNKYGIRVRVPDELRPILGKNEITRSLRTGDPAKAKPIYHRLLSEIETEFDAARKLLAPSEPALLTVEMAESLVQSHFQEQIFRSEGYAYRVCNDSHVPVETRWQDSKELLQEIELDLHDARLRGEAYAVHTADQVLKEAGFPVIAAMPHPAPRRIPKHLTTAVHVDRASDGYKRLLRLTYLAQVEVWERMRAIVRGEKFDLSTSLFPRQAIPVPQSANGAMKPIAGKQPASTASISVRQLLKRFLEAHPNKTARWKMDIETPFHPLMELVGAEADANSLTKQNFRDLLALIRRLPTQIGNNKKKWAGKTFQQIAAATEKEDDFEDNLLHPETINKYMRRVAQVMKWAENEPLIDRNNASGISIPADEIDDDAAPREPFAPGQLNAILSSNVFTQPDIAEPALYWTTLLSLFHGMRSEEILQLRSTDFQKEDGIWFVDIHKRDGNHLKNRSAVRKVPLHPCMAKYGLRSLVKRAAQRSDNRLFNDVERSTEGKFTPIFSRRYSRFLDAIGAKTEKTSFHSFRHTFRDAARNSAVSDDRACAIGGWKFGSGVHTHYGNGLAMSEKFKAIKKIAYPKVDFSRIKIIDWSKR